MSDDGFMDVIAVDTQPAPDDHPKDVFILVHGKEDEARFELTEAQSQALKTQLSEATGNQELVL